MIERMVEVDRQWLVWINGHHNPVLDAVLAPVSYAGEGAAMWTVSEESSAYEHLRRRWRPVSQGVLGHMGFRDSNRTSADFTDYTDELQGKCMGLPVHRLRRQIRLRRVNPRNLRNLWIAGIVRDS